MEATRTVELETVPRRRGTVSLQRGLRSDCEVYGLPRSRVLELRDIRVSACNFRRRSAWVLSSTRRRDPQTGACQRSSWGSRWGGIGRVDRLGEHYAGVESADAPWNTLAVDIGGYRSGISPVHDRQFTNSDTLAYRQPALAGIRPHMGFGPRWRVRSFWFGRTRLVCSCRQCREFRVLIGDRVRPPEWHRSNRPRGARVRPDCQVTAI